MASSLSTTLNGEAVFIISGIFAMLGLIFAMYNILGHVTHYNSPRFQRPIVRILFIIPIYASVSWASLRAGEVSRLYMEIARDWYEAFVIYCFLRWILVAIGGEETCGNAISRRMYMSHPTPLCCLPQLRLNTQFLKSCKALTLQFVILKPIMACVSFILLASGHGTTDLYMNPAWQEIRLILYNTSYTLALYGLFLFYLATKEEMSAYSPIRKFIGVKTIVFATYWQQLFIPWINRAHADQINDFVLCIEMLFFSYLHFRAFPWWEFKSGTMSPSSSRMSILEELDVRSRTSSPRDSGIQFTSIEDTSQQDTETTKQPILDDGGSGENSMVLGNVVQYGKNLLNVLDPSDVAIDTADTFGIPIGQKEMSDSAHVKNMRYTALGDSDEPPAVKRVETREETARGLMFDSEIRVQSKSVTVNDFDDPAAR